MLVKCGCIFDGVVMGPLGRLVPNVIWYSPTCASLVHRLDANFSSDDLDNGPELV